MASIKEKRTGYIIKQLKFRILALEEELTKTRQAFDQVAALNAEFIKLKQKEQEDKRIIIPGGR